jgi:glycolate oxidase FAD binding subunit
MGSSPETAPGPATLAVDDPVLAEFAAAVGAERPVAVVGGRTRWSAGGAVAPEARLLRAPSGIVRHTPDEMTVTVRAGTPVADLHAGLAQSGQRTSLPQRSPDATVGGALAVGENDLRALGRGLVRTALLQVRYVSAEGRIVTGGGPTVKNVSGFDLPRLLVGSLGTLGLMAEVILRTNPVPAVSRWLTASDADPFAAADALLNPSAVLWDGTSTWVELEGHGADVAAQQDVLSRFGSFVEIDPAHAEPGPEPSAAGDGLPVGLPPHRWSLPPAQLARLGTADAADGPDTGRFVAAVGLGIVHAERPQPARPIEGPAVVVTERLKSLFDPTGRLNPGRHVGRA